MMNEPNVTSRIIKKCTSLSNQYSCLFILKQSKYFPHVVLVHTYIEYKFIFIISSPLVVRVVIHVQRDQRKIRGEVEGRKRLAEKSFIYTSVVGESCKPILTHSFIKHLLQLEIQK